MAAVKVVRIYIKESDTGLDDVIAYLKNKKQVKGMTLFRAVSGYGQSGVLHQSRFADLLADLPLSLEFFDKPALIDSMWDELSSMIAPGHMISWLAEDNK